MKALFTSLLGRAADLAQTQPLLALGLGAALLTSFLALWIRSAPAAERGGSLPWLIYTQLTRLFFAAAILLLLAQSLGVLRSYLRRSVAHFQQTHGRITEANYNAVQSIWGAEQVQPELSFRVYYEEEVTERTDFEDPTKLALLRKKTVRRYITGNPFLSASHDVHLKQNPRKKGSAVYGGYETDCRFSWRLKNPADRTTKAILRFPLPAPGAMYDELTALINNQDVLPLMELSDSALVLTRDLAAREELNVALAFKSRGLSHWYFQVTEPREIRDFTLKLHLADLPATRLNYPEGCMSPTEIKPSADGRGSELLYRLDHAITQKGMGIALPALPQPGETTNAVLEEAERGWMLLVAAVLTALTLARVRQAVVLTALISATTAMAFAILGDCSDLILGFWGTALLVFLPLMTLVALVVRRFAPGPRGRVLACLILVFGVAYPVLAGLDPVHQNLYLNGCGLMLLGFLAWQLIEPMPAASTVPHS